MTWRCMSSSCPAPRIWIVGNLQRAQIRTLTSKRRGSSLRCDELLRSATNSRSAFEDQEVKVHGIIRTVRKQKRNAFAEITDGSTIRPLQAVLSPRQAESLTTGTAVEVSGLWKACPPGKEQTHELQATAVKVHGPADPQSFPLQKKYQTPQFLRQIPHLRLRTPFNAHLSRFRSECIRYISEFFSQHPTGQIFQVHPPLITSSDCEGAGEVFTVSGRDPDASTEAFFQTPRYLTVSSQLHLEAYAAELGRVWTLSPTFRAEKGDTPRHLSEFYMLEAELNFTEDLDEIMALVQDLIRHLVTRLQDSPIGQEILTAKRTGETGEEEDPMTATETLRQRWQNLIYIEPWPRIRYTRAISILQEAAQSKRVSFTTAAPTWSGGLQLEHERYLVDIVGDGAPVFVTDYPKEIKPFYMAPSSAPKDTADDDSSEPVADTVACFDLLMPSVAEVVGGSLREHRLPFLLQNMREQGLIKHRDASRGDNTTAETVYPFLRPDEDLGALRWYADLRRWGSSPHGGFGLGFDRLIGYLAGVGNVRDVVAFPRYYGRADC